MTVEELAGLPEYAGIFYDPQTGKSYREDGSETGFTFENARWSGPFDLHFAWPWLNPFAFATHQSAVKILELVRRTVPGRLTVAIDSVSRITGPFTRTPERSIVVTDGSREERYSAGLLANSVIRNGETRAAEHFLAELRLAGFSV